MGIALALDVTDVEMRREPLSGIDLSASLAVVTTDGKARQDKRRNCTSEEGESYGFRGLSPC